MAQRYLKNIVDNTIYDWHPILAANPKCVEVTEEEAYPERFVKPEQVQRVKQTRRRTKKELTLETQNVPEPPTTAAPEIATDASRGLPE